MSDVTKPTKHRPAPGPDVEGGPFWDACTEGTLLYQRCDACGNGQLYPRARCLDCGSMDLTLVESSGEGTIYSFTVVHQHFARPWREMLPYVVVLVDLDEGARLMSNLVDCDPDAVAIGDRVRVRFDPAGRPDDEGNQPSRVPVFTRA